jgi:hypothetical protein
MLFCQSICDAITVIGCPSDAASRDRGIPVAALFSLAEMVYWPFRSKLR